MTVTANPTRVTLPATQAVINTRTSQGTIAQLPIAAFGESVRVRSPLFADWLKAAGQFAPKNGLAGVFQAQGGSMEIRKVGVPSVMGGKGTGEKLIFSSGMIGPKPSSANRIDGSLLALVGASTITQWKGTRSDGLFRPFDASAPTHPRRHGDMDYPKDI